MRIEIAGANITSAVVEVIDTLQTDRVTFTGYASALDRVIRHLILSADEVEDDATETLNTIRQLTMLKQDLAAIAMPPDADNPENDVPLTSL